MVSLGQRRRNRREQQSRLENAPLYNQDPRHMPQHGMSDQLGAFANQGGTDYRQARQAQLGALGMYQDMAAGQGPSLAQQQLAAGTGQNIANQMSLAAQGRGGNLAGQARQASAIGAGAQMGLQQQMAQMRAQEQLAAMQGMAGMSNQLAAQGQQQQMAGLGMGLDAQGQANQWGLGQRGLDQQQLGLLQQQQQANRGFGLGLAQGLAGAGAGAAQMGMVGAGVPGAAAAFSDERVKQNIRPGDMSASMAVGEAPGYFFEYQPGYGDIGPQFGPMAQDLEKTPAGAQVVQDTPHGKVVDLGKMAQLGVAASSEQEHRIRQLEAQLGDILHSQPMPYPNLGGLG